MSDVQDNVADDGIAKKKIGDTRQPKLTIRHLHKLRKIRELKELERVNLSRQLELIYGAMQNAEEAPGI